MKNMKSIALEFYDRYMMVIRFLLFCKRDIIFLTIIWIAVSRNQVLGEALGSPCNGYSYRH